MALLGHNGAGKSTLAHSLIGINKMKNGKISLKVKILVLGLFVNVGNHILRDAKSNHMITQPTVLKKFHLH